MATAVENLIAARNNLAQVIATETARWVSEGCQVTHSIDGESFEWNSWLTSQNEAMAGLNKTIAQMSTFIVRSRGKP